MAKVSVIVPAAGAGRRFGGKANKIFERLGGGQPVFIRTLEAFTSRDDVCQTLLVVAEADMGHIKERFGANLGFMGVRIVPGGDRRSESVRNALAELSEDAELVCVHDAVRPCIAQPWIDEVFAAAAEGGAAILAWPIHGTLKRVADGLVRETVDRSGMWIAQTPQVFRRDVLLAAYASGLDATDDAALVEAAGHPVRVVMGDPRNVKITTPADLAFAAAVIKTLPRPKTDGYRHPFEEPRW
ncbi:MAG: 2-C-methyl-D-erythritol 4-phosphate cytidylyltransferase [Planctomycetes bacterium]|nr:2-C-methyl-D-erythritol 4-phosphate cytidylyltransferase [Planctomycetota bacterium]